MDSGLYMKSTHREHKYPSPLHLYKLSSETVRRHYPLPPRSNQIHEHKTNILKVWFYSSAYTSYTLSLHLRITIHLDACKFVTCKENEAGFLKLKSNHNHIRIPIQPQSLLDKLWANTINSARVGQV